MHDFLEQVLQWVAAHPHLAGLFIFLLSFAESLAGIGLLVPGAFIMFGLGALIALGSLEFWPIYLWSVGGAIIGDGLSYWLGHHFHQQMRALWPFRNHPDVLEKGERFFHRHGGKSVLLGRFIGPLRPVIPVVAGMLDMPAVRFYIVNIVSAFAWAPLYLLPGMAFGASLALAGEVAGRLALLIVLLLAAGWLLGWLIRTLYRRLQPRAQRWTHAAMLWASRHRYLGWLVAGLVDPDQPASRSLVAWLVLLTGGFWLFLTILLGVVGESSLRQLDIGVNQFLQGIRNPLIDNVMVVFSALGDSQVVVPVLLTALAWLWWRKSRQEMWYWLAAVVFGKLAVVILKGSLGIARPTALYSSWEAFSFPSGHATMSVIIYGYLAVSSARELPPRWRWLPYALGGVLIAGIAFSRLYLGAHWPSDVLGGLAMGLAWVALSRIALRRHRHQPGAARGLTVVCLSVFLMAGVWHVNHNLQTDLKRYAVREQLQSMSMQSWWEEEWRQLPAFRQGMEGSHEQPFNLQWAGALEQIVTDLKENGWRSPVPLDWHTTLRWLQPAPELLELPLLPHLHHGRFESLQMVYGEEEGARPLLIQLWDSGYRLQPGGEPLWLGTVSEIERRSLRLVTYPRSRSDYDAPLARLRLLLPNLPSRLVHRGTKHTPDEDAGRWHGELLLLRLATGRQPPEGASTR